LRDCYQEILTRAIEDGEEREGDGNKWARVIIWRRRDVFVS
jgi:hypothetical protein